MQNKPRKLSEEVNDTIQTPVGDPEVKAKTGFLFGVTKVVALVVPVVSGFAFILEIALLSGLLEPRDSLPSIDSLIVTGVITFLTAFIGVCVCSVQSLLVLRWAKTTAIIFLLLVVTLGLRGFLYEILLGKLIDRWFESTLMLLPVGVFYYMAVAKKIRRIAQGACKVGD
jgi:hypothetical protein